MSKVAIVGVEGSGKTTLMAAFGEKYMTPDANGYSLDPQEFSTFSFVSSLTAGLRKGKWPSANAHSSVNRLGWSILRNRGNVTSKVGNVTFLDYAGEVYRLAFGEMYTEEERRPYAAQIEKLKAHVDESDVLLVLANLSDIINGDPLDPRVRQMVFQTGNIIKFAGASLHPKRVALVFSQADKYREIVESVGGLRALCAKYLPLVASRFPNLPLLAVAAVNKTDVDAEGNEIPAPDFGTDGLDRLMEWIVSPAASRIVVPHLCREKRDPMPGDEMTVALPGGAEMTFCWCPATTSDSWKRISGGRDYFLMGSPETEAGRLDNEVLHHVTLTRGFWMGKTAVTQAQWESVMGCNPSRFDGRDRPVERVSWDDCQEFVRKINAEGRVVVSLPTEAQWEYACRAGTTTPYDFGTSLNGSEANCNGNYPYSAVTGPWRRETAPGKSYLPNAWGLFNMHGNVNEWCQDWFDETYYVRSPTKDPTGGALGVFRVCRGGSWRNGAVNCRSARRNNCSPRDSNDSLGVRLVCMSVSDELMRRNVVGASKVAILGAEGSGTSTLMAAFGEKYMAPDANGYSLDPLDERTFSFASSSAARLRRGEWTGATASATVSRLVWSILRRRKDGVAEIGQVELLDCAGEVCRQAFDEPSAEGGEWPSAAQTAALKAHVDEAESLLVLVNLGDVIDGDLQDPRVQQMIFQVGEIVKFASSSPRPKRVALLFAQADKYRETIASLGGLRKTCAKYLPLVAARFPDLQLYSVAAVNKTVVDEKGNEVPAPDFSAEGLEDVMGFVVSSCFVPESGRISAKVRRWVVGAGLAALVLVFVLWLFFGPPI